MSIMLKNRGLKIDSVISMKLPQQRKDESLKKLKERSIPYIEWLPHIESSNDVTPRSAEDIAKRAITCLLLIQAACDLNHQQFDEETKTFIESLLDQFQVSTLLTEKEQTILNGTASEQDIVNMVWKYESYWVLLWALGIVEHLDFPNQIVDCDVAINAVSSCQNFDEFMQKVRLKEIEDILDQADLIYRYHWACVDARLKQQEAPANLNASIVMERHGALNWLINIEESWDHPDVST